MGKHNHKAIPSHLSQIYCEHHTDQELSHNSSTKVITIHYFLKKKNNNNNKRCKFNTLPLEIVESSI